MEQKTLFITGASGFMGGCFLKRLNFSEFKNICCLDISENPTAKSFSKHTNIKFIKGNLFDVEQYRRFLAGSDIVLHFAAATGKTTPEEYYRINKEGTEVLVQQCEKLGIKNFLYVSTIAVKYPDISRYYYAKTKLAGEQVVKNSRLNFTIVRPTVVIGRESAILQSLAKLCQAPVIPVFGMGTAKIQPIYIEDLIDCYTAIIKNNRFQNETIDLGGPEIITIKNFLRVIHQLDNPKKLKSFHIPLKLLILPLSYLEKVFLPYLPFTIGQLSLFRYDSTIEENSLFLEHRSDMKGVNEMVALSLSKGRKSEDTATLDKECTVFCTYLSRQKPDDYILQKYRQGNKICGLDAIENRSKFEQLLIKVARINPFFTRLADSYTCLLFKQALLRKKLTLILAVLECCAPTYQQLDSIKPLKKPVLFAKMTVSIALFAVVLFLSVLLLLPFHVVMGSQVQKSRIQKIS